MGRQSRTGVPGAREKVARRGALWSAWKCRACVEVPSYSGTPTPYWRCRCAFGPSGSLFMDRSRPTNPALATSRCVFGPPGTAVSRPVGPHIQAHQPPTLPSRPSGAPLARLALPTSRHINHSVAHRPSPLVRRCWARTGVHFWPAWKWSLLPRAIRLTSRHPTAIVLGQVSMGRQARQQVCFPHVPPPRVT